MANQQSEFIEANDDVIRKIPAGFGAFGLASVYQQILWLDAYRKANPEDAPPFRIETMPFNEGPDDGKGPAYDLGTNLNILNFPMLYSKDDSGLTMDLIEDQERSSFLNWVLEQAKKISSVNAQAAKTFYEEKIDEGYTDVQISFLWPEHHTTYMLSRTDDDKCDWYSYMPRRLYGEYLGSRIKRAQECIAEINAHYGRLGYDDVVTLHGTQDGKVLNVLEVGYDDNDDPVLTVTVQNPDGTIKYIETDMLTVATGHQFNQRFMPNAKRAEL